MSVEGVVRVEGEAATADVLLVDGDGRITGAASTDAEGRFAIDATGRWALARIEAGPVAAGCAEVVPGERVVIELAEPFAQVRVTVEEPPPEGITLFMDPVELPGLPGPVTGALKSRGENVVKGRFRELPVAGESRLTVQRGRWRVGGGRIVDGPLSLDPPRSTIVTAVGAEPGGQLGGTEYGGFDVEIDGDLTLALTLRDLSPDEL